MNGFQNLLGPNGGDLPMEKLGGTARKEKEAFNFGIFSLSLPYLEMGNEVVPKERTNLI